MIKIIFSVLAIFFSQSVNASNAYLGFMIEGISRGGFIAGYRLNNKNSIEVHFGGFPHVYTYGVSWKLFDNSNQENFVLLGYTSTNWPLSEPKDRHFHGLNFGYGHNFGENSNHWTYPVEIGGGPAYNFMTNKWMANVFVGYGALYNSKN